MYFIKSAILPDEKLIFATRPHWIVFAPAVMYLILAAFIYIAGAKYGITSEKILFNYSLQQFFSGIVGAFGTYWLIRNAIFFFTSEYGITDKRVLMKTGWIARNTLEIFLDKVEAINVDQSILGRILGYGTLIIVGTGGTQDPYFHVPAPLYFRRIAQEQVDTEVHKHRG